MSIFTKGKRVRKKTEEDGKAAKREPLSSRKKIIIGGIALLVVIVLLVVYRMVFVRPELPTVNSDETISETDAGDGLQPLLSGERKSEDFYTFLLIGRDTGGGGNCDTMILVGYDMTNQRMTLLSIPRDTMVNVPWDVKKINSIYPRYGAGERGITELKKEISQLVGFQPDYTVVVEWEAVGELVDAIGGVWFDVPKDMNYDDPYQDLSIHIKKGEQKLDGKAAMGVIRWRKNNGSGGYQNGDLGRIETQQAFLKAVISQVLQVRNAMKLYEFSKIFKKNVTTELTIQNLFWLGKGAVLGGLTVDNVEFLTMPGTGKGVWSRAVGNMQSYVVPNADELLKIVNEKLSPFKRVFTLKDLDIMFVNGDGSVGSTTGYVADTAAAQPPVIPENTEPEIEDDDGSVVIVDNGTIILPYDYMENEWGMDNTTEEPGNDSENTDNQPAPPETGGGTETEPPAEEPTAETPEHLWPDETEWVDDGINY